MKLALSIFSFVIADGFIWLGAWGMSHFKYEDWQAFPLWITTFVGVCGCVVLGVNLAVKHTCEPQGKQ